MSRVRSVSFLVPMSLSVAMELVAHTGRMKLMNMQYGGNKAVDG